MTSKQNVVDKETVILFSKLLKEKDGVVEVDTSDILYDENDKLHYYNNDIRIVFENSSLNYFKLDKFNKFDLNVSFDKVNKHLEKSEQTLDEYIMKINKIKIIISNMKKVIKYIDELNIDKYSNIKKIQYCFWKNQIILTLYTE